MMLFADHSRGRAYAKDPAVVKFAGRYWMYYSIPPYGDGRAGDGWAIGIAASEDLDTWERAGELTPQQPYEANGLCAPGAMVHDGRIHLFYQTYGNGPKDAICHAYSDNGIDFIRNDTNPIFKPTGSWNNGRAIDADVIVHEDRLLLYFATRDPHGEIQMQGVAAAPLASDFGRSAWTQLCDEPILKPELDWEGQCIEAAATCKVADKLVMFYAGAYNNWPQQIGVAISTDGVNWERLFDKPFLPNGPEGSWNASESGHPYIFIDDDGRSWLFYQGNNDNGKTWYLSKVELTWDGYIPALKA